jgi:hypothetical protein
MKLLLTTLLVLTLGCDDGSGAGAAPDCQNLPHLGPATTAPGQTSACLDGGVAADATPRADTGVALDTTPKTDTLTSRLEDAQNGYISTGVYVNLGDNPCSSTKSGWETRWGVCYELPSAQATGGVCGTYACGTYAPGTVLVWDTVNPRFRYMLGAGLVCLPNDVPYVVPCT